MATDSNGIPTNTPINKLSELYFKTIERWKPIKTRKDFWKMLGSDCPFCRDVEDNCSECYIGNGLCRDEGIYNQLYDTCKDGKLIGCLDPEHCKQCKENEKIFRKALKKGKRLLKKEYKKALKNEHKN